MSEAARKPDLRLKCPPVLSDIDQSRAVVLAGRCLHKQTRSNHHLLVPSAELLGIHRLRADQIHRYAYRYGTQSGAIKLLLYAIHVALEVPNRIWQQSRYVRRSAEAIEGVKVSENFSADSPARVRDREPVENHISRTQRIRERNRIRMDRRNDIGARAQALSYAQTCQCDAQTEQHDRAADLDHHASTQILQPLSPQVNCLEFLTVVQGSSPSALHRFASFVMPSTLTLSRRSLK